MKVKIKRKQNFRDWTSILEGNEKVFADCSMNLLPIHSFILASLKLI